MNREDYLRELDAAGGDLKRSGAALIAAANPIKMVGSGVARDWKWWLPGASIAGFVMARFLRRPVRSRKRDASSSPSAGGAAYWVPTLIKLLPRLLTQLMPLFLSLRSARKP